jgi:hypothetical protein
MRVSGFKKDYQPEDQHITQGGEPEHSKRAHKHDPNDLIEHGNGWTQGRISYRLWFFRVNPFFHAGKHLSRCFDSGYSDALY